MAHSTVTRRARQIETLRTQFAQADGLPFADVLTADCLEQALRLEKAQWRRSVYTLVLTLLAFLSQVIHPDSSCRAAVARVLAWLVSRGERPCSPKTGRTARARRSVRRR